MQPSLATAWNMDEIFTIFGPKMMVKSGLEKIYFEIPSCGKIVIFITEFWALL